MSRASALVKAVWRVVDSLGWVIALVFIGIAFSLIHHQSIELREQGAFTRIIQVQGRPPAACLYLGIEKLGPALTSREPEAAPLLHAYVEIQRKRYEGVACPVKR